MTEEQKELIQKASESLQAARLLHGAGHHGFAASRAYYAMFYATQAFLLTKGLAFSSHAGVIAAFGQHIVKAGTVPPEFHRYLIHAAEVRHAGDYSGPRSVTQEESTEQIEKGQQLLDLATRLL